MTRIAVKIAYLGAGYRGSQAQPGLRTVEGDIASDLCAIRREPGWDPRLRMASRTDGMVNALGNVAAFDAPIEDPFVLLKALNAVSKGVFYRGFAAVGEDFNPRHADMREYRYVMRRDGIDPDKARECASLFVGEHDFSGFCRADGKSPVLAIDSIRVSSEGDLMITDFRARYYLWNMVRRLMAAIAAVGRGDASIGDVEAALGGNGVSFGLARPDALTLTRVEYGGIDFIEPEGMFDAKVGEELFKDGIRRAFFSAL
ncbi:MAG: tRNA pseudouridine(38-40) synthase TruA [Candidatus Methanoplasma sp.]|jgi:tRNA pseudouridine38-40 synthase|nr:tRNA pseudouridine(38-40) synthase TruA [Candidatus Methanoplasma sp.]